MSTTTKARRLIVTLPGLTDNETETMMAGIGWHTEACGVDDAQVMYVPDDGDRIAFHTRVKVAPGVLDVTRVALLDGTGNCTHALEPGEARQLAAMLLRAADEAEGR